MHVIATMRSAFPDKFGIPRQSGLVEELRSTIVFQPAYRNPDALRGLEGSPTCGWCGCSPSPPGRGGPHRPPAPAGGNTRMGVFATRSPFRPNPIGLSCVKIHQIQQDPRLGPVIHVLGADLMDGTPILDLKPYIPTDAHPEAARGVFGGPSPGAFAGGVPPGPAGRRAPGGPGRPGRSAGPGSPALLPGRPQRVYGLSFGGKNIRFTVADGVLTVVAVEG